MKKVIIGATKKLVNFSVEDLARIKDDLMLTNPDYLNAVKFSRVNKNYIQIPKYKWYFEEDKEGNLLVPLQYKIPEDIEYLEVDERKERTLDFPKTNIVLREDQEVALNSYLEDPEKGLISMPTGKGKSILGIILAQTLRQKTLVIVHKLDLLKGWEKDIQMCFPEGVDIGTIQGKNRRIGNHFTLATIQTLNNLSTKEMAKVSDEFGLVLVDECLVGDTLIIKSDGTLTTMEEISDTEQVFEGGVVSNKFSKKAETVKVQCSAGILEGSLNHKTLVLPKDKISASNRNYFTKEDLEEKPLDKIQVGDYLPVIRKIPHTTLTEWSPEFLAFVSLIQADGHLDKVGNRIKVSITSKDLDYIREVFVEGIKAYSNTLEVKESKDCRGNTTLWVNSPDLKGLLEDTFKIPRGKKSDKIDVPNQIFNAPLESIRRYIEVYINCEGDLAIKKSKGNELATINVCSVSEQFIQKFSLLLRKFGVVAHYQKVVRKNRDHLPVHRLVIGSIEYNHFLDEFRLIDRKTADYNKTCIKTGFNFENIALKRVHTIEETDEVKMVYDFTTETHTYVANGVLTHNCHHTPASTYNILDKISSAYRVGLSATPERSDGLDKVMYLYLGDIGYEHEYTLEDTDIMPVEVKIKDSLAAYKPLALRLPNGKYKLPTEKELKDKTNKNRLVSFDLLSREEKPRLSYMDIDNIVFNDKNYQKRYLDDIEKEYRKGRSIVVFLTQIEHCDILRDKLLGKGIPKEDVLIYNGKTKDREQVLKQAEERDLITIVTYSIATEGTNVKRWEVAFILSSINNGKNIEQAVGRIRRAKEGKIDPVICYDYKMPNVYSFRNHINTRKRRYSLLLFDIDEEGYIRSDNKMFFVRKD